MAFVLYCTACHSVWKESCWKQFQSCPYTDCDGTLTLTQPKGMPTSNPRRKEQPSWPLFDAAMPNWRAE